MRSAFLGQVTSRRYGPFYGYRTDRKAGAAIRERTGCPRQTPNRRNRRSPEELEKRVDALQRGSPSETISRWNCRIADPASSTGKTPSTARSGRQPRPVCGGPSRSGGQRKREDILTCGIVGGASRRIASVERNPGRSADRPGRQSRSRTGRERWVRLRNRPGRSRRRSAGPPPARAPTEPEKAKATQLYFFCRTRSWPRT